MSNEYKELIDRLARARNFKGGSYVLITAEPEDKDIRISMKGENSDMACGAVKLIEEILNTVDFELQKCVCEKLTHLISDSNMRRFQASEMGALYE